MMVLFIKLKVIEEYIYMIDC